jgi:phage portal protein BeeE
VAAARRSSGSQAAARKAAPRRVAAAKAVDVESTDGTLVSGTIADEFRKRIPDREIYALIYAKHPWVRSTIDMIAVEIGRGGFSFVDPDEEDASAISAKDNPAVAKLRLVLRHVFPGQPFPEALEALGKDLCTHGWGFWRRMRQGKTVVGLERMDPRFVVPRLSDDGTEIISFLLRHHSAVPEGIPVATNPVGSEQVPVEDVIFFKLPGGDVVLGAPSLLESLDFTTALDINIRTFRNRFFKNGAVLGLVLANEDGNEDDFRAAQKAIEQRKTGVMKVGSTLLLTGKWLVHQMTQAGKNEVDFVGGTKISREEIGAVYHVPPSKILMTGSGLGSSGKTQDDATFEEQAVLPLEELIYAKITLELLEKDFGVTDLAMVPKRRNTVRLERFEAAMQLVQFGGTGNEARELVGYKDLDVPGMDLPQFKNPGSPSIQSDILGETPAVPGNGSDTIPNDSALTGGNAAKGGGRKSAANPKGWY